MKILIDNGHGIDTKGKRSPDGRLLEYRENRIIARGIVFALQARARGLDASLLVPEETDISLPERCRRVNEWCHQLGKDYVLLISIHCPAVLTENLFMDNHADCAFLLSPKANNHSLTSMSPASRIISTPFNCNRPSSIFCGTFRPLLTTEYRAKFINFRGF